MIPHALRALAIAIAVAGVVDPVLSVERRAPQPLAVVVVQQGTHSNASVQSATDRVRSLFGVDFDLTVREHALAVNAAACPATGGCIVISDGTLPTRLSAGAALIGGVYASVDVHRCLAITGI